MTTHYRDVIPERAQKMLFYMERDNWLYNYQFVEGINRALTGMSQRTPFRSKMEQAAVDLKTDYESYQLEFEAFFPDLVRHSELFLETL